MKDILTKISKFEWVSFLLILITSFMFFRNTFHSVDGVLHVGSKVWSDFAATIPLIRSFSLGSNFPPEYPIFSGEPIRYHFVFFAFVGLLEKFGLTISNSLNILSALFMSSLIFSIYLIGKFVFRSRITGVISVILFLLNGSFAFVEFFKLHPLSPHTLTDIVGNKVFPSFGPYDGKLVSAFWNLNIYTNQRHLAMAYFLFLVFVFYLWKNYKSPDKLTARSSILIGVFIGVMPFVHMAVFSMAGLSLIIYLVFYPRSRRYLFVGGVVALLIAIPQVAYMGTTADTSDLIKLGYLIEDLTAVNFVSYWLFNLGLAVLLFPFGFYLSNRHQKIFLFPFLALFIIGNILRLSPEIAANHKFFNLFLIGINFYTAYLLAYFFNQKSIVYKAFSFSLLFTITLSGFIELFPIINDSKYEMKDYKMNKTAYFIHQNTPKDSVFLTSTFLYTPASLAGRKIFMGWPYFAWSAGYDTYKRDEDLNSILSATNKRIVCNLLGQHKIDYLLLEPIENNREIKFINYPFFENNFDKIYSDNVDNIDIYKVGDSCVY